MTILWIDNDPSYLQPFASALTRAGHNVTCAARLRDAEQRLRDGRYDLCIIDVMFPTTSDEEDRLYPPTETEKGNKTGLVLYRRWKATFTGNHTAVLVLTVRLDREIQEEFVAEGLPETHFATKMSLRDVTVFVKHIESLGGNR